MRSLSASLGSELSRGLRRTRSGRQGARGQDAHLPSRAHAQRHCERKVRPDHHDQEQELLGDEVYLHLDRRPRTGDFRRRKDPRRPLSDAADLNRPVGRYSPHPRPRRCFWRTGYRHVQHSGPQRRAWSDGVRGGDYQAACPLGGERWTVPHLLGVDRGEWARREGR